MDELTQVTAAKDSATGHLTSLSATRAATQAELRAVDAEQRLAALEAAMKALRPAFTPPAPPSGYRAPTLP